MSAEQAMAILAVAMTAVLIAAYYLLYKAVVYRRKNDRLQIRERYWHSRYLKMQHERNLARISANQKQDLYDELINRIHLAAQAEAKRIISEWEPSAELTEAEFRKAEFMANQREMRDAGRKSMPREDQEGQPAIIRRFGKKRK